MKTYLSSFMDQTNDNVESPCRDKCTLDTENICQGCFRSLEEIIQWPQINDKKRREVLHNAAERRKTKNLK
jgi:predicted Fe-S protein YdhL (DUF1289 family)